MRILHVMPSVARSYGGPTQSLLGYLRASRAAGLEVEVVAPRPASADEAWWRAEAPWLELRTFAAIGDGALVTSPALTYWLARHGANFDVVHIHALQNPVSSSAARLSALRDWPFVLRPFGMLSRFTFTHRHALAKRAWYAVIDQPAIAKAAGIHFTTEGERDEGMERVGPSGPRGFVVPPPWNGKAIMPDTTTPPRLLCVSRIHPVKNLERLLEAWPLVVERVADAELVLAGDGDTDYVKSLEAKARSLGAAGSVRFVGFVDGLAKSKLLASSRAFVLISHHENFGVAVLEAVAAGLPCVISREVHLAPFVRQHQLGAIVRGDDVASIADAIVTSLTDMRLGERVRVSGPREVAAEFSTDAVGSKLAAMYQAAVR